MGFFGSRKNNFEEHVKRALGLRGKFRKGSVEIDIKKIDALLADVKGSKEFDRVLDSRQFDIKHRLEEEGLDDDKFEEIRVIMKREKRL